MKYLFGKDENGYREGAASCEIISKGGDNWYKVGTNILSKLIK